MATVPSDQKFHTVAANVQTVERGSSLANSQREIFTMEDITSTVRPYKVFSALLTQSGGDVGLYLSESPLVIGTTYLIDDGDGGDDFTNVGAPNSNNGTSFIATGTTPANWTHNAILYYNSGAPVATVLENTIGNIWFTYVSQGIYKANFATEQNVNKIYVNALPSYNNDYNFIGTYFNNLGVNFVVLNNSLIESDSLLSFTPIEIRVYE